MAPVMRILALSVAVLGAVSSVSATHDASAASCAPKRLVSSDGRSGFAFPTVLEADAGAAISSACIQLVELAGISSVATGPDVELSINGGAFKTGRQALAEGDSLQLRAISAEGPNDTVEREVEFDGGRASASLTVQTRNSDRAPRKLRVGRGHEFRELADVADQLRAGDLVEVESGRYAPVDLTRAGTRAAPIVIRGIGTPRPLISGGERTVQFNGAHHVVFENFEITGGSQVCVRTMADGVVLRRVHVHDCARHGVLGADLGSGSLTIDRVEVARVGANRGGENSKHAIYVATDRDRFPGSVLRVEHSYLHDFKGSGVKSRSERTEIRYSWIETLDHPEALYSVELYGYEAYPTEVGLESELFGSVLVHRGRYGLRLGGDGTGSSRGRVRLANNTVALGDAFDGSYVIRMFQALDAVYLVNNAFVRGGRSSRGLVLFRDDISGKGEWVDGRIKIAGRNNLVPLGTRLEPATASDWSGTIYSNDPVQESSLDSFDIRPRLDSPLRGAAAPLADSPPGYKVDGTVLRPRYRAPAMAPMPGSSLVRNGREDRPADIGAW